MVAGSLRIYEPRSAVEHHTVIVPLDLELKACYTSKAKNHGEEIPNT